MGENDRMGSAAVGQRDGAYPTLLTIAGLGCLLAWSYVTFFSRVVHYSTRNSIEHLNSTYTFACCGMIAVMLLTALPWRSLVARVLGTGAFQSTADRAGQPSGPRSAARAHHDAAALLLSDNPFLRSPAGGRLAAAAALLMVITTVVLEMVESNLFQQPWCSIAATLAGAGQGTLYLAWATQLSAWPRSTMPVRLSLAFIMGAALFVAVLHLPLEPARAAACAFPLASALCLALTGRLEPSHTQGDAFSGPSDGQALGAGPKRLQTDGSTGASAAFSSQTENAPLPRSGHIFVRALACVGVLGLAESFERALFLEVNPIDDTLVYRWVLLVAVVIASAILLLSSLGRRGRAAVTSTSHASMFAMALLFLLTPIVSGIGLSADLATMVCYALFYLMMWTMLAQIANAYQLPAHVCFGLGLGVAYTGCLIGTFAGSLLTSYVDLGWRLSCLLALLCACLVLVSLLCIVDDRTIVELLDGDDERPAAPRRFMLRCEQLARERGLTPRETEVMVLVAKGRSAQKIQEMLGLSAGTVNTYLARIYKKLDVHARQELLDLLEEPQA